MAQSPWDRDSLSYIIASLFGAAVAGAASLLRHYPRGSKLWGLGTWLGSMTAAIIVLGLGWNHVHDWGELGAATVGAGWLGGPLVDRIAAKALRWLSPPQGE